MYLIGIQYLRAIAALMVVFHHARWSVSGAEAWTGFGYAGVDIFFVISGFVMAQTTQGVNTTVNFYERFKSSLVFIKKRLTRIVPLYFVCLIWSSRKELLQGQISKDLRLDFIFVPHVNSNFPGMIAPTVTQGWTLNYEMFFYLLFACSMLLGKLRLIILCTVLVLFSLAGFHFALEPTVFSSANWIDLVAHFYSSNILLEFGLGIAAQRILVVCKEINVSKGLLISAVVFGFLTLAMMAQREDFLRGIALGVPAFLIVCAASKLFQGTNYRTLSMLGDASYAIYLFHWASFGLVKPLTALLGSQLNQPVVIVFLMFAHFLVAIASGIVVHLLIERPLLKNLQGLAQNRNFLST
jgi:exopolysaccharide production protein ExoZ